MQLDKIEYLIKFIFESSLTNLFPISLAIVIVSYSAGSFLVRLGASTYVRASVYIVAGIIGGLWSYSYFDIPHRSIEKEEFIYLVIGTGILSAVIVVTYFSLEKRRKEIK